MLCDIGQMTRNLTLAIFLVTAGSATILTASFALTLLSKRPGIPAGREPRHPEPKRPGPIGFNK